MLTESPGAPARPPVLYPSDAPPAPSAPGAQGFAANPLLIPFPVPTGKAPGRPQLIPVATPPHVVPVVSVKVSRVIPVSSAPRRAPDASAPKAPPPLSSAPRRPAPASAPHGAPLASAPRGPLPAASAPDQLVAGAASWGTPLASSPRGVPAVAPPGASAPRPLGSLIPDDVLEEYEREMARSELEAHDAAVQRLAQKPLVEDVAEAPSIEQVGAVTEEPADEAFAARALGKVSLFEDLSPASLEELVRGARQLDFPAGEYLFVEGDTASSFLVITEGTVEVLRQRDSREVALRHMSVGEPLGLFGLFSGAQRAACARAIGDVQALEIPSSRLQVLLDADDALHARLLRFYRERLMEGFLGSTRIFSEVDSIARARIIGRFKARDLLAGESLVQPGEVANVLAVVTHGELVLAEKPRAGIEQRRVTIGQGEFVALTGALSGIPTRMRLGADAPASVMLLNQKELFDLLRDYPALRNLPARLGRHATAVDRDLYTGHTGIPGL